MDLKSEDKDLERGQDPMLSLPTQPPRSLPSISPDHHRIAQGEWILEHFTARQLITLQLRK